MLPLTIAILSDVHLEFAPASMARTTTDLYLFAGNISKADPFGSARWCATQVGKTTGVLVPGPDELLGFKRREAMSYMREAANGSWLNILDRNAVVVPTVGGGIRVLGCTSPDRDRTWLTGQIEAHPHTPTLIVTAVKPSPKDWQPLLQSAQIPLWAYGGECTAPLPNCEGTAFAHHPRKLTMGQTVRPALIPLNI